MKKILYIFILFSTLTFLFSCEMFVIGSPAPKKKTTIIIDRSTAVGTVCLFKIELDSNNIMAAANMLATAKGEMYLASERYELTYDLGRLQRLLAGKPITKIDTDSLSDSNYNLNVEFNNTLVFQFSTIKIRDEWFITKYEEK